MKKITFLKKIFTAVTVILLVISQISFAAFAANGNVSYMGQAKGFVFEPGSDKSPTDLFPDFKNVMPGDVYTQNIVVANNSGKYGNLARIFIRALGAQNGSEEFLSQLRLKVELVDDNSTIFEAPADETAGLTDWVKLGTLEYGEKVELKVTLIVPGELDNRFQGKTGYLDWEFMVEDWEQNPVKPPNPPPHPINPGNPYQPVVPEKPDKPDEPDTPVEPDVPDVPDTPDEPNVPDEPDVPDVPDTPDEPDVPDEPDIPDVPDTPDEPDVPDVPDTPDEPDFPAGTEGETKPDKPVTGDTSLMHIWIAVPAIAIPLMLILVFILVKTKKKDDKQQ